MRGPSATRRCPVTFATRAAPLSARRRSRRTTARCAHPTPARYLRRLHPSFPPRSSSLPHTHIGPASRSVLPRLASPCAPSVRCLGSADGSLLWPCAWLAQFCKCRACVFCKALQEAAADGTASGVAKPKKKKRSSDPVGTPEGEASTAHAAVTTPSAASRVSCQSGLKGDFNYQTCGAFCKSSKSSNHCK